jgi:hypothetical protein
VGKFVSKIKRGCGETHFVLFHNCTRNYASEEFIARNRHCGNIFTRTNSGRLMSTIFRGCELQYCNIERKRYVYFWKRELKIALGLEVLSLILYIIAFRETVLTGFVLQTPKCLLFFAPNDVGSSMQRDSRGCSIRCPGGGLHCTATP